MSGNAGYKLSSDEFATCQAGLAAIQAASAKLEAENDKLKFFLGHVIRTNKLEGERKLSEDAAMLIVVEK